MRDSKNQNFLKSAAILAMATIFVKIVGAIYKIPLAPILGDAGFGCFHVTYNVYTLILAISTAGIPVALSRMVSAAAATGKTGLVKRYFSVALPAFSAIGVAAMLVMFLFADGLAGFMNNSMAAPGIRVLAPAVFFVCIVSVYRGYAQGFENMVPTAVSQVVEVVCKAVFGIALATWLIGAGYELQYVSAGAILGVTIGLGAAIPLLVVFKRKIDRSVSLRGTDEGGLPSRTEVLVRLFKVSIPITLGSSFMSLMTLIDSSVVMGRLQSGLGLSEYDASELFGIYSKGLTVFNLPAALVVPVSVSIIPAIAAAVAGKRKGEAGGIMQSSLKLVNLLAMPAGAGIMVLSGPIMTALYNDSRQMAAAVLSILGAAAFFVCLQLITTAILQANGHERITMLTFPVGGIIQVTLDYFLVGNPSVGIIGSPIGTLTCYTVISLLNIGFILARVKERPKFAGAFAKPLVCTAVMAAAAYSVFGLLSKLGAAALGTGRMAVTLFLALSIGAAVVVYAVLIIATRTVTRDDLKLVPKGEKLADLLRLK